MIASAWKGWSLAAAQSLLGCVVGGRLPARGAASRAHHRSKPPADGVPHGVSRRSRRTLVGHVAGETGRRRPATFVCTGRWRSCGAHSGKPPATPEAVVRSCVPWKRGFPPGCCRMRNSPWASLVALGPVAGTAASWRPSRCRPALPSGPCGAGGGGGAAGPRPAVRASPARSDGTPDISPDHHEGLPGGTRGSGNEPHPRRPGQTTSYRLGATRSPSASPRQEPTSQTSYASASFFRHS